MCAHASIISSFRPNCSASERSAHTHATVLMPAVTRSHSFLVPLSPRRILILAPSCQAGRIIRKLKKNTSEAVQKQLGKLLDEWKRAVAAETQHAEAGERKGEAHRPNTGGDRDSASKAVKAERPAVGGETGKPVKAGRAEEGGVGAAGNGIAELGAEQPRGKPFRVGKVGQSGDSARDKLRELLVQYLCMVAHEVEGEEEERAHAADVAGIAVAVEQAIWHKHGGGRGDKVSVRWAGCWPERETVRSARSDAAAAAAAAALAGVV